MERNYIAFISYRHAELDSAVAKQLHTSIEQFVIPKSLRKNGEKKLGLVFRDQEELPISSNLSDDICTALDHSQFLIVVCSKNTAASPWVGREIEYFLSHHDRQHTLAALASGEPMDVFPKSLTCRYDDMGELEEVEPLAIDIRSDSISGMKKLMKREILRLCAALIGCPYDALVMRQQRRKRRRLAGIMGLILAVVTGFSAMTLVKNYQIDQKNQELAGMNQTLADKNQELEDKNDQLAQQKAEVQLRESELLTEKGLAAVAANKTQTALEYFLAALPSSEEDRPYYALAEQGLTSALEVYSEDREPYKAFGIRLEQTSPVVSFAISPDGTRLMTVDEYSLVTCFDTATAQVLWSQQLHRDAYVNNIQAVPSAERNCVFIYSGTLIAAMGWDSGEPLWTHTADGATNLYLSPDHTVLAYRSQAYTDDFSLYENGYVFLRTDSGELLQKVPIGISDTYLSDIVPEPYFAFPDYEDPTCQNGAFSPDGHRFATYYQLRTDDGTYTDQYLVIDLENGTCQTVCSLPCEGDRQLDALTQLCFIDDGNALLSIKTAFGNHVGIQVTRIDLSTGACTWQADLQGSSKLPSQSDRIPTLIGQNVAYLARGEYLYVIDLQTGQEICSYAAASSIVCLDWAEPNAFSMITADGRYTLNWANRSLGVQSWSDAAVYLGDVEQAQFWNQGGLRFLYDDTYLLGVDGGAEEKGYGFIATVSDDSDTCVVIQRLTEYANLFPWQDTQFLAEDVYLMGGSPVLLDDRHLFLGRSSQFTPEGTQYACLVVDLQAQTCDSVPLQDYLSENYLHFLPGSSNYITSFADRELILHYATGGFTTLLPGETLMAPGGQIEYGKYLCENRYQADGGSLLSAAISEDTLFYWYNGENKTVVEIPEKYHVQFVSAGGPYRFLHISATGYLIMGNYSTTEANLLESLVVYDTKQDIWYDYPLTPELRGSLYTASQQPWALLLSTDNQLTACHITTGEILWEFSLALPQGSVDQFFTTLDDQFLVVKTKDQQLHMYDIASGEEVFQLQMDATAFGSLQIAEDSVNQRLYIWDTDGGTANGYCIDRTSWTVLAKIPGLLYYDSPRNTVYCYRDHQIFTMQAPTLEELVQVANNLMD